MKKLEEDLGVILFERKKNKLELNQNGFYVLDLTRTLLENADSPGKKGTGFEPEKPDDSTGDLCPCTSLDCHTIYFSGISVPAPADRIRERRTASETSHG